MFAQRTALVLMVLCVLFTSMFLTVFGQEDGGLTILEPQTIDLNGSWRFQVEPRRDGEKLGWTDPVFDDSAWAEVSVPHTWNVMPEYVDYDGIAWYRREFTVAEELSQGHIRLQFDAVFYQARVWLNGIELGSHVGGYTPFTFDVTGILRFNVPNVLVVEVDNLRALDRIPAQLPNWSFDWENDGGIVRDVSLLITSPAYIERQFIVAEPDLIDSAEVYVTTHIANQLDVDGTFNLVLGIHDESTGALVWSANDDPGLRQTVSVPARSEGEFTVSTVLPDPKLWHFDFPNLYTLVVELQDDTGRVIHRTETIFGIRKIEIREARFYLNGEWVRLVGLTRHADSPEYGLAEPVSFMAADYDDLKRLNMVFSRPVHYPQHQFIMDYCDRHGILLIPEIPAWQLSAWQMGNDSIIELEKQQIIEMIEQDFNHPSVWAWSLGNEIESKTVNGHHFVQEMVGYIKTLDPTRYVSFASNRLYDTPEQDATQYGDFVLMNQYFGGWGGPQSRLGPVLDAIHQEWPDKLVIISEFGFEPRWNRLWGPPTESLDSNEYYFVTDDELNDPAAIDIERQRVINDQLAVMRTRDFVGGAIFWTYQDYRTPSGFKMGLVNMEREHMPAYDVLREEYAPGLFQNVTHSTDEFEAGQFVTTDVTIWSRGPVETQMPAYTLRGYTLHWEIVSNEGTIIAQGSLDMPTLVPDESWTGQFEWTVPEAGNFHMGLTIVRPTGFVSIEKTIEMQAE